MSNICIYVTCVLNASGGQKGVLDPLELESQSTGSWSRATTWVLGIDQASPGRAAMLFTAEPALQSQPSGLPKETDSPCAAVPELLGSSSFCSSSQAAGLWAQATMPSSSLLFQYPIHIFPTMRSLP